MKGDGMMPAQFRSKDHSQAYAFALALADRSRKSDSLYGFFDDFASLQGNKNAFVRTRALMLRCAQAMG